MKKVIHYIPHILFAASLLYIGAYGKLTGAPMAIGLFETLGLFGQPEYVGRYLIGLGELFAAIGVFFIATRRVAASIGIVIMLGAIFFHFTTLGGSPILPIITLILGVWILFMGYGCKTCTDGSCMVCQSEEPLSKEDLE